ncbi:hypothetical protein QUH73_11590 [Labilibaculum sp. K2S]|uniref:hypothetical protein n=1 Tax=Labilibaculum sp. K2S TaxID=3056386 RepID=UPI0025A3F4CC|nr:hypothetical protein [Labilibaculum sp. K2S]MDM8160458.1 hypothetical protein [Labilibaculum sp. K2S]
MEYRTMNRKELAMELDISTSTLCKKMKKLDPSFLEHIKNKSLLFENEVKYIHDNIEWRTPWEIKQGYANVRRLKDTRFDD